MLKRLLGSLVKKGIKSTVFDETNLTDQEWLAWKIRCARNLGFKGEFNKEEMLASRSRPTSTENQSKHTKESE